MAGWHFLRLKKGFDYNPEQNNRSVETKVVQDCCQELRDKRECCSLVSVCLAVVVPSEGAHTHCPAIGDLSREPGTPQTCSRCSGWSTGSWVQSRQCRNAKQAGAGLIVASRDSVSTEGRGVMPSHLKNP